MSKLPAPGLKRSALNCGCTATVCARVPAAEAASTTAKTALAAVRRCMARRRSARHSPSSRMPNKGATLPAPADAQPPEPATAQTPALPFGWHWPATHDAVPAHCASVLHAADAHTAPLQAAPPHESCTIAEQAPEPLHRAASVITPSEHVVARHSTAPG